MAQYHFSCQRNPFPDRALVFQTIPTAAILKRTLLAPPVCTLRIILIRIVQIFLSARAKGHAFRRRNVLPMQLCSERLIFVLKITYNLSQGLNVIGFKIHKGASASSGTFNTISTPSDVLFQARPSSESALYKTIPCCKSYIWSVGK